MKYFLDTEFIEDQNKLKLISIGIVCEDGREYYAESSEFSDDECNNWVKENVLPLLNSKETRKTIKEIKKEVIDFIGNDIKPVFYGYYADYDWVLFSWIFGRMIDLQTVFKAGNNFPMYCRDLKQQLDALLENTKLKEKDIKPEKGELTHYALEDARWNQKLYNNINSRLYLNFKN